MKLSIITVNLNNAAGLEKTAESIVNQTFTDFEWIVIDGGSTDGSVDVIRKYEDRITYWVSEKDSGIYNAMNKGVKVAKGEYLQFLNSGDCLAETTILENVFASPCHNEVLYGDTLFTYNNKVIGSRMFPDILTLNYYISSSLCHQAMFVPKALHEKYPFNEGLRIASDWEFFFKLLMESAEFRHLPFFVCLFDTGGISQNQSSHNIQYEERIRIINQIVPEFILREYKEGRTGQLLCLRRKYRLYSKFITLSVIIMNWFDSFVCKK